MHQILKKDNEMGIVKTSKMKYSFQREQILNLIKSTKSHPTADWIYDKLKPEMPNLSLGTVYRNLSLLRDMGEIKEFNFNDQSAHYDGFVDDHQHFICNHCHSIYDLHIPGIEDKISNEVKSHINVEIEFMRTEFYGICEKCKPKE